MTIVANWIELPSTMLEPPSLTGSEPPSIMLEPPSTTVAIVGAVDATRSLLSLEEQETLTTNRHPDRKVQSVQFPRLKA